MPFPTSVLCVQFIVCSNSDLKTILSQLKQTLSSSLPNSAFLTKGAGEGLTGVTAEPSGGLVAGRGAGSPEPAPISVSPAVASS